MPAGAPAKSHLTGYTSGGHRSSRSAFPSLRPLPLMKPATDYIRHAARLARKVQMDAALSGAPEPDAEFYKVLAKALDEIAAGLEQVSRPRD